MGKGHFKRAQEERIDMSLPVVVSLIRLKLGKPSNLEERNRFQKLCYFTLCEMARREILNEVNFRQVGQIFAVPYGPYIPSLDYETQEVDANEEESSSFETTWSILSEFSSNDLVALSHGSIWDEKVKKHSFDPINCVGEEYSLQDLLDDYEKSSQLHCRQTVKTFTFSKESNSSSV
jgi:hypothetical protein